MRQFIAFLSSQSGCGLALTRIVTAIILLIAGYAKFFMMGMPKVVENFKTYGMPIPDATAPFIGALELVGGILLLLGLFSRYLGTLFAIEFVVATYVKWVTLSEGFRGARVELMILVVGILIATNGGGAFSLDRMLKRWDA